MGPRFLFQGPGAAALLVATVCCLLLAAPATAQTRVRPGIRVGTSVTTNWGDAARPVKGWRAGLVSGAFLALDFADAPGLQLELNYVQKGARVRRVSTTGAEEVAVRRLNYVETSILGKFQLAGAGKGSSLQRNPGQWSVLFGPTIGVRTHANFRDELRSGHTDYGLVLGAEYRTGLGMGVVKSVVLDVRYQVGIARIEEQADVVIGGDAFDPNREGTFRNQGFTVTTGLSF